MIFILEKVFLSHTFKALYYNPDIWELMDFLTNSIESPLSILLFL